MKTKSTHQKNQTYKWKLRPYNFTNVFIYKIIIIIIIYNNNTYVFKKIFLVEEHLKTIISNYSIYIHVYIYFFILYTYIILLHDFIETNLFTMKERKKKPKQTNKQSTFLPTHFYYN